MYKPVTTRDKKLHEHYRALFRVFVRSKEDRATVDVPNDHDFPMVKESFADYVDFYVRELARDHRLHVITSKKVAIGGPLLTELRAIYTLSNGQLLTVCF